MTTEYEKLSKQVTLLQRELMGIDNYSEEAYQLMEKLIDELDYQSEVLRKELVIGVYSISNFGGIEILAINSDTVKWRYNFGEPKETKESVVEYGFENEEGDEVDGFFADGTFIEFDEILRYR